MVRQRNSKGEVLNTPLAWSMVPGAKQISDYEFLYMLDKGGFADLPELISWSQYQKVLAIFFPWRPKIELCRRCEGSCRDRAMECKRCDGNGVEAMACIA